MRHSVETNRVDIVASAVQHGACHQFGCNGPDVHSVNIQKVDVYYA